MDARQTPQAPLSPPCGHRAGKTFRLVMAGLVPAISLVLAPPCRWNRDHRDKPGDDEIGRAANSGAQVFAATLEIFPRTALRRARRGGARGALVHAFRRDMA